MSGSDVVTAAVEAIQRRSKDPRLALVPGLAGDLMLIGAALDRLNSRLAKLEPQAVPCACYPRENCERFRRGECLALDPWREINISSAGG